MPWINMVYEYDDSYEGFLCCIYESYVNKEFPIAFFSNEEFSVLTLYPVRCVKTDLTHSSRILRSIESRSARAARLLYRAFHTCMADREACLYRFIQKLYADGPQFLRRTSDEACFPLYKAVRHLSGELEKLRGFVRFSDFGGILGAEIEPKNRVLPFLRGYFCSRYANEPFFLYDRTHGELLLYCGGRSRIMQVDSITLPKRYRCTMTEFQSESSFTPEASPADVLPPSVPDEISAPATLPGYALSAPGSCI